MSIYTIYTLPTQLRPTAIDWTKSTHSTQKERAAQIKALPDRAGLSLTAARVACESAVNAADTARRSRRPTCDPQRQQKKRDVNKFVRLPSGTLAARLHQLRCKTVLDLYRAQYRYPTGAHGYESVRLTDDPAQVGAAQERSTDWSVYSRSTRYPAQITNTCVTVPTDWRVRVQRRGIAVVDGMLTLDAAPLEAAPDGVDLYAATWIEQGHGYTVHVLRGYLARAGATSYHGDTAQKSLAGLRRKIAAAKWVATLRTADLDAWVRRAPALVVCVTDASAVGACDYGIRSWCQSVGIDYSAGCAPLADVYAAYQREPRAEARAAILHALRKRGRAAA